MVAEGATGQATDDELRPVLDFFVDASDVLAEHAEENELDPGQKDDRGDQRGEALDRLSDKSHVDGEDHEAAGEQEGQESEQRGGAQRYGREREDAVHGQADQLQEGVFARSREALFPLDLEADLAKAHPGPQPAQVAMALGSLP